MLKYCLILSFTLVLSAPRLLSAQDDQFGTAVAVTQNMVVVAKTGAGRGPASLSIYSQGQSGDWGLTQNIVPEASGVRGEGLTPSVALTDHGILIGSGDPNVAFAAYTFVASAEGAFVEGDPVARHLGSVSSEPPGRIDLSSVMRILQPPRRVVAAAGNRLVVGFPDGSQAASGVRVYDWVDGNWAFRTQLSAPEIEANAGFGTSVAILDDRIVVGAPGYGASGSAFVFREGDDSSQWNLETVLSADSLGQGSNFGWSLAISPKGIFVGAPGSSRNPTGSVHFFRTDSTEYDHSRTQVFRSPTAGDERFGHVLAVHDTNLWVGAPRAQQGRGAVYGFEISDRLEEIGMEPFAAFRFADAQPGWLLGFSVAVSGSHLVTGAPGADGALGRVAVVPILADGMLGRIEWLGMGSELTAITGEEVTCNEDRASGFSCDAVDLLSFLPITDIGGDVGERLSDVWGWSDPETGREFALVGRTGGAAIVEVTNPVDPVYVGVIPANASGARDLKVYRDHLFFTGDGAGRHGLIVFDLTRLREVWTEPMDFEPDAVYDGIASAHNLIIDTEAGFAYPVGSSGGGETCGGGLHMVNIQEPKEPVFAGCYTDTEGLLHPGRTHDGQCVIYNGPDSNYKGREICFASNETALRIVDVTDKSNPIPIAAANYPGIAYVHQGWLTEDHRYFYLNDELDELVGTTDRTRTLIWDIAELDDPVMVGDYYGPDGATDHNLYIKGDRMYQANYQAGFRVIDISERANPIEIGYFDTTPYDGNPPGFFGAWTAYPYFESGTIVVTSMREGLFLLKPAAREMIP